MPVTRDQNMPAHGADRSPAALPAASPRPTDGGEDSHLTAGDEDYRHDKQLVADLADLNRQLSRYLLAHLDTDAGRTTPVDPDDEHLLGMWLVQHGHRIIKRAERRTNGSRLANS